MVRGITLLKSLCLQTQDERTRMGMIPYALAIRSIMYTILCARPNVSYALRVMSRYSLTKVRVIGWLSRISFIT